MKNKILRLKDVQETIGLSRSYIYGKLAEGCFPKPIPLGDRAVGWLESDIQHWIQQRIEDSRDVGH